MKNFLIRIILAGTLLQALSTGILNAQDTIRKNIYHPSVIEQTDSFAVSASEEARRDSIARAVFIQDSLIAREAFIRDSIIHHKRIIDSLNLMIGKIQGLPEAYFLSGTEEIISGFEPITISGDSMLGDFVCYTLPFGVKDPYVPWKIRIPLSGRQVKIITGKTPEENVIFQTPRIKATFTRKGNMLIIQRPGFIQNSQAGALYKLPVDTVFYDRNNRIVKIKNYTLFYGVINGNQKGNHLFTNRVYAKQYEYAADGKMAEFELVRYCDRLKAYESNKVCSIITFTISRQGNSWLLTRKNNPVNSYSDGTFTFIIDDNKNISSISFANEAKTEKWQRNIEMNKDGFVNCYIDKSNDLIRQSLCMIYHNEPGAKVAVETITTIFEKDGISYFQRNNTTGKIRTRDKMTLEWTPWHNEN